MHLNNLFRWFNVHTLLYPITQEAQDIGSTFKHHKISTLNDIEFLLIWKLDQHQDFSMGSMSGFNVGSMSDFNVGFAIVK